MTNLSYSSAMEENNAYLTITLDLRDPVEIGDFAALFAGLGSQFDDYLKHNHPELKGGARMYVKEVRRGSIVADLFPNIQDMVGLMDTVLIVLGFGALFSDRLRHLIRGNHVPDATKTDLQEIGEFIRSVSNDANGDMTIETVKYEQGVWHRNLEIKFTSGEAREAERTISGQKEKLDKLEHVDHKRVLMTFERSRKSDTKLDATGELVVIEEVIGKPKALIYGSELIEQTIKHEIREVDDNIYKKGFIVDANVRLREGRVVAYVVTEVHQVIDLPDD